MAKRINRWLTSSPPGFLPKLQPDLDFGGEVDLLADLELVAAFRLPQRVSQAGGVVLDAHELSRVVLHFDKRGDGLREGSEVADRRS